MCLDYSCHRHTCVYMCVYIYIYIHIYIPTLREDYVKQANNKDKSNTNFNE